MFKIFAWCNYLDLQISLQVREVEDDCNDHKSKTYLVIWFRSIPLWLCVGGKGKSDKSHLEHSSHTSAYTSTFQCHACYTSVLKGLSFMWNNRQILPVPSKGESAPTFSTSAGFDILISAAGKPEVKCVTEEVQMIAEHESDQNLVDRRGKRKTKATISDRLGLSVFQVTERSLHTVNLNNGAESLTNYTSSPHSFTLSN